MATSRDLRVKHGTPAAGVMSHICLIFFTASLLRQGGDITGLRVRTEHLIKMTGLALANYDLREEEEDVKKVREAAKKSSSLQGLAIRPNPPPA